MSESLEITLHNRQQAWAAIKAQVFPFLAAVLQAGALTETFPKANLAHNAAGKDRAAKGTVDKVISAAS